MATTLHLAQLFRSALSMVGLEIRPSADVAGVTITSGTGAPSAAEPNGSTYHRMDGATGTTIYKRVAGAWVADGATGTDFGAEGLAADVIAESTAGEGVTVDGVLLKDGDVTGDLTGNVTGNLTGNVTGTASNAASLSSDDFVRAAVAAANAPGGVTTALLTVALTHRNGTTPLSSARQVYLVSSNTQYGGEGPPNASLSLGTITKGSVIATLNTSNWIIQTDAAGEFAATLTNTDDEALYFTVLQPKGVSDLTKACVVLGSNVDIATWSA